MIKYVLQFEQIPEIIIMIIVIITAKITIRIMPLTLIFEMVIITIVW